jgi:hypothetical protein
MEIRRENAGVKMIDRSGSIYYLERISFYEWIKAWFKFGRYA